MPGGKRLVGIAGESEPTRAVGRLPDAFADREERLAWVMRRAGWKGAIGHLPAVLPLEAQRVAGVAEWPVLKGRVAVMSGRMPLWYSARSPGGAGACAPTSWPASCDRHQARFAE